MYPSSHLQSVGQSVSLFLKSNPAIYSLLKAYNSKSLSSPRKYHTNKYPINPSCI